MSRTEDEEEFEYEEAEPIARPARIAGSGDES